jgi:hypothetical protein
MPANVYAKICVRIEFVDLVFMGLSLRARYMSWAVVLTMTKILDVFRSFGFQKNVNAITQLAYAERCLWLIYRFPIQTFPSVCHGLSSTACLALRLLLSPNLSIPYTT